MMLRQWSILTLCSFLRRIVQFGPTVGNIYMTIFLSKLFLTLFDIRERCIGRGIMVKVQRVFSWYAMFSLHICSYIKAVAVSSSSTPFHSSRSLNMRNISYTEWFRRSYRHLRSSFLTTFWAKTVTWTWVLYSIFTELRSCLETHYCELRVAFATVSTWRVCSQ
jgi:hypothetical protein